MSARVIAHARHTPDQSPASANSPTLRPVPSTPPVLDPQPQPHKRLPIWLGVHLQGWQLHATLRQLTPIEREHLQQQPLAIVDCDRRATLLACNALAIKQGVRVGHSLNAAIALCSQMQFLPRAPDAEGALLETLATQCERYTSTVSIEPPNQLLLEVRGSLRLFGGLAKLVELIGTDLNAQGVSPQLAVSPTAQGALWLSRAVDQSVIVRPRELIPMLSRLSVSHLLWPAEIVLRLARFGVRSIGDLLRLPRAGLARRIGRDRMAELDHAVGRHGSVRKTHRTRESYQDRVLLEFDIETTALLSRFIEERLARLARYLMQRTLASDRIHLELKHRGHSPTPLVIGLASPTSNVDHIAKLMHEQLAKLVLPAPVREVLIRIERLQPAPSTSHDLFRSTPHELASANSEPQARLLEQLRARCGEQSIKSITARADHRPEFAHQLAPAVLQPHARTAVLPSVLAPRPLWLLPTPKPMRSPSQSRSSSIVNGPEIIESGWWDGLHVHREYFIARSARNTRAWIYQDRSTSQWFVHGLFG